MSPTFNRRTFLAGTTAAYAALKANAALAQDGPASNSDRSSAAPQPIVLGVMGLSRGSALATEFGQQAGVTVKYLCDVDSQRANSFAAQLKDKRQIAAQPIGDFRRILDDPEIDVLVCAAPNHWHAPATILGCQAGKHIYVEKPCSHNPQEGEWMVAAAKKYHRCVQMGTQRRSSVGTLQAMQRLHAGAIGRVYLSRAYYNSRRGSIGKRNPSPPPAALNYELWQGPAPRRPFRDNVVHYNWHWHWHWGNGELGNNGVHTLDLCRWGLQVDFPIAVTSSGGRYCFDDDQETPDTHTVAFDFADKKSITWHGLSCNGHERGFVHFFGQDGALELEANGEYKIFDASGKVVEEFATSDGGQKSHVENFLAAVRAQDSSLLNQEISEGHKSTLLCHLGNIAHRVGRRLQCDHENGRILNDPDAMTLWQREYAPGWDVLKS